MFERLDEQRRLTRNQKKIIAAAILGDALEFFDYFLIGFVLAFIIGPWHLTYGQSAVILLSSGVGAMIGAGVWGWLADRIGRRRVFIATVLNFSIATGLLALTPDNGWIYLTVLRFVVGFGVGGLYAVDLPLVQEFVPTAKRGLVGGIVTAAIPAGVMIGAFLGAFLAPEIGWRGLFLVGVAPALMALLIRAWVPESPHWLARTGRLEEARRSLAWAMQVPPSSLKLPIAVEEPKPVRWTELFRYPRSLAVSWIASLGAQTGAYGVTLWVPTLFVLLLRVPPAEASYLFIFVTLGGLVGRIAFSLMSDRIGRRTGGMLCGFGGALFVLLAGMSYDVFIGTYSLFWLLLIAAAFFYDGGFAILGPYMAEAWPARLRTTGMGSAYGFGGLGKIIGPLGLALIVGSSNIIKPEAKLDAIVPAFLYLAAWLALTGIAFLMFGIETADRSITEIDEDLHTPARTPAHDVRAASGAD
jgi:putative MFS transporter